VRGAAPAQLLPCARGRADLSAAADGLSDGAGRLAMLAVFGASPLLSGLLTACPAASLCLAAWH